MKKFLLIVSLLATVLYTYGQGQVSSPSSSSYSSVNKLFRDALKTPRRVGETYRAVNKSKSLTSETVYEMAREDNMFIMKINTTEAARFGDVLSIIGYIDFLPAEELDQFNMERVMGNRRVPDMNSSSNIAFIYYYDYISETFLKIKMHWSGEVSDGYASGKGLGVGQLSGRYYAAEGTFANGFMTGDVTFTMHMIEKTDKVTTNIHADNFKNGMALCKMDGKLGYVDQSALESRPDILSFAVKPTYTEDEIVEEYGKLGDYFVVLDDKKEEIKINKKGENIGYSDKQAAIHEQKRLEEESRLLAEKKAKEEKERAEAEEAERKRIEAERLAAARNAMIKKNSNIGLWEIGSRLCHSYNSWADYVIMVTLEEWNASKSKAKVRVVASPSSTATYNGESLEKNNIFWIDTKNEGWYLAWPEEVERALRHDNSRKQEAPSQRACSRCAGRGRMVCSSCNGTGYIYRYERCYTCKGAGYLKCVDCYGRGLE